MVNSGEVDATSDANTSTSVVPPIIETTSDESTEERPPKRRATNVPDKELSTANTDDNAETVTEQAGAAFIPSRTRPLILVSKSGSASIEKALSPGELVELTGTLMCQACQDNGQKACHVGSGRSCLVCHHLERDCLFVRDVRIEGTSLTLPLDVLKGVSSTLQTVDNDFYLSQKLTTVDSSMAPESKTSAIVKKGTEDNPRLYGTVGGHLLACSGNQSFTKSWMQGPKRVPAVTSQIFGRGSPSYSVLTDYAVDNHQTPIPWLSRSFDDDCLLFVPGHAMVPTRDHTIECECGSHFTASKPKHNKSNFKRHLRSCDEDFECPKCKYTSNRVDHLREHFKRVHGAEAENDGSASAAIPYGNRSEATAPEDDPESDRKCHVCGMKFTGSSSNARSNMKRHKREVHEKAARYTCVQCDASFNRADNLMTHVRKQHPD